MGYTKTSSTKYPSILRIRNSPGVTYCEFAVQTHRLESPTLEFLSMVRTANERYTTTIFWFYIRQCFYLNQQHSLWRLSFRTDDLAFSVPLDVEV